MKAYEAVGGSLYGKDFDDVKLVASGVISIRDPAVFDFHDLTTESLAAATALTHPDLHPPERKAEAQRVTQELLALKPFVFPEPEPEPPPMPDDVSSNYPGGNFSEPSLYPCEDCRDTVPLHYCNACKARWEEEQEKEREREEEQRLAKNARQRQRYSALKLHRDRWAKPTRCSTCDKEFKPKRSDAQYCSAACRQRAYVKREGKQSNFKPLGRDEIERAITDAFTSHPENAFSTDDLCERVYFDLGQRERKHYAAVIAVAKKVCEQLGENWDWWRAETRGGTLVFWNRVSVTSYALARLKADLYACGGDEDVNALIAPGGRYHEYVVEGGVWWGHCQEDIASFKQTTAKQSDLEVNLAIRHGEACPTEKEARS
jgi:hypothetical protein